MAGAPVFGKCSLRPRVPGATSGSRSHPSLRALLELCRVSFWLDIPDLFAADSKLIIWC